MTAHRPRAPLRWYWAPAATFSIVRVWREDGPGWAATTVVGGLLLTMFVIWKHRNDPPEPPPFEAKTRWAELPVQPPSGAWQRRAHLLNATIAATFAVWLADTFAARGRLSQNSWPAVVFWSLFAILMLQAILYIAVWARGQQLLRRELRLGYTTWRKR